MQCYSAQTQFVSVTAAVLSASATAQCMGKLPARAISILTAACNSPCVAGLLQAVSAHSVATLLVPIKQAWEEACKTKVSPRSQWPEMYRMLSAIMQLKTWSAACNATGEFAAGNTASQPAAVISH